MTSLYAAYCRERGIDKIVEEDHGFATYRYLNDGKTVYIVDIYVAPFYRGQHVATHLADLIVAEARAAGAKELLGTVVPHAKGSTESMLVLVAYGMKLHTVENGLVVFRKEL